MRHCRIAVENGQYTIGSATFDSLTELVQYYESNPLYRRMKLKYAINDEVLKSIGEVRASTMFSMLYDVIGLLCCLVIICLNSLCMYVGLLD